MPLVDARDLLEHASQQGYPLPFFAPNGIEEAIAAIRSAEALDAPLVVDLSRSDRLTWDIGAAAVEAAAARSAAPVVMHLSDVTAEPDLTRAVRLGCGAISLPDDADLANLATAASNVAVLVLPPDRRGFAPVASLEAISAAGRAAAALAACRQRRPVEHVVMFNADGLSDDGVREMLGRGTEMLAAVPGVRAVRTGTALTRGARYTLCWLVLFANEEVVRHYRDHPTHVAFADNHFRPFASDRMTIDFRLT